MLDKVFKPTIGLEVHAELKTQTKMFCDCLNDPNEKHPNINICAICAGHPGVLPTINKQAIEYVLQIGTALGGKAFVKNQSKFDRKNYFYPDLPKGYQISQYDQPLIEGGELAEISLERIHLEEDAGRLIHNPNSSLVDLNRAGVPLMELVTKPDIKTTQQAIRFAKELRLILRYLDISDADMENGQLRLEANISLSADDNLGTKVEVKNINSFKALGEAINYEIKRQSNLLKANKKVTQETRGWDSGKKVTVAQRGKEGAKDYRYFPEPDLPPLNAKPFNLKKIKQSIPELPANKRDRFVEEYKLSENQVEILVQDQITADYFEEAVSELDNSKFCSLLFNYLTSDLQGLINKEGLSLGNLATSKIPPVHLAHLVDLAGKKEITSRIAKDLLQEMIKTGLDPHEIIQNEQWTQVSGDEQLQPLAEKIIADNQSAVADYKKGKVQALQFLIGMAMSELGGKADPNQLRKIFEKLLK